MNIFDDLDSAVAGLKEDILKQDATIGRLKTDLILALNNDALLAERMVVRSQTDQLAGKDREIAELQNILKAQVVDACDDEIQKLRAERSVMGVHLNTRDCEISSYKGQVERLRSELSTANARLKEAEGLLYQADYVLSDTHLRRAIRAFLKSPAAAGTCEYCIATPNWWITHQIDGKRCCSFCIQRMLGNPNYGAPQVRP